jgi:TolB-like protein
MVTKTLQKHHPQALWGVGRNKVRKLAGLNPNSGGRIRPNQGGRFQPKRLAGFSRISHSASSRAPLIAVTSFEAPSLDPDAQASIVSALSSALLEQGKVRVMEREQMDRILAEQGFSASGACDITSCAVEMGRILAVDQLVSGRIGRVGQTYTISARRVDVRTGEVLRSITRNTRGEIDDVLTLLVPKVAEDLVKDPGRSSETVATTVATDSAAVPAASPEGIQPGEVGKPLWPWIAGGAVLVGGGVAGALLLLGSDDISAPAPSGETGAAGDLTVRWAE